jgi:hypothetical protein
MRWLWLLVVLALAGCTDKERTPVMGHWTGGFYTDEAEALRGYLQLYRTGDKFKLRLASKVQELNMQGTWTMAKGRIELRVGDIEFDNPSEATQKAMGIRVMDSEKVRNAYAKPLILDVSSDQKTLQGLTMTLDNLQGSHRFVKGGVTADAQKALDRLKQ